MIIFNCSASSEVATPRDASSARTAYTAQVLETDRDSRSLGKKEQSAVSGGILERLGAYLVKVFKALRDSIGHLLRDKSRDADNVAPLSLSRAVVLNPSENQQLSSERAATATSGAHGEAGSVRWDRLAPSHTCPNGGPAESSAAPQQKEPEASVRDVLRREWREIGKGLNALYLYGYGQSVPAGALRVLTADKELGTARVEAFDAQLASARRVLKTTDQAMTLQEVINGFNNVECCPTQGDALAAFVGGMTSFADSFAREYAGLYGEDCLRVAPVSYVENFVLKFLTKLTVDQTEQLTARLLMGMSKQAQQIFTFAYEQVELSGDSKRGDKLSQLGFGARVMDALRKYLELEPMPSVEWVSVDDLDIYELAALDRVMKRV